MAQIKHIFVLLICLSLTACFSDNDDSTPQNNLLEVASFTENGHKISLQNRSGVFTKGYSPFVIKITDASTGNPVNAENVSFTPVMHMTKSGHSHSCPHSAKLNKEGDFFNGYAIFTMHTSENGYWELNFSYTSGGKNFQFTKRLEIKPNDNKNVQNKRFTTKNGEVLLLCIVAPTHPREGRNNLIAGLYKNTEEFPMVNRYTIEVDPRMPDEAMKNHSSYANQALTQPYEGYFYLGIVNYTMSGLWRLNFIIKNENGEIVAGNEVPPTPADPKNPEKSEVYVDIEF